MLHRAGTFDEMMQKGDETIHEYAVILGVDTDIQRNRIILAKLVYNVHSTATSCLL